MRPDDALPSSPAAERNREPILTVLDALLPGPARVLEIACGTGQHAEHFAGRRPDWTWQPSDADAQARAVTAARCAALPNVRRPLVLDVLAPSWPDLPADLAPLDAVYAANLLHISPWPACAALMHGAARRIGPAGRLIVYGPFVIDGEPTAPSNLAFDADLRNRDPAWGLRRLVDVCAEAAAAGLALTRRIPMPANNQILVFEPACENLSSPGR